MAVYELYPGESEQHTHNVRTKTELLEGSASITIAGRTIALLKGKPVPVPANTQHQVTNTGDTIANCNCNC